MDLPIEEDGNGNTYVPYENIEAFLNILHDTDHALHALHLLRGIATARCFQLHEEAGDHPTECCKYCLDKERYQAAVAFAEDQTDENLERLQKANEAYKNERYPG